MLGGRPQTFHQGQIPLADKYIHPLSTLPIPLRPFHSHKTSFLPVLLWHFAVQYLISFELSLGLKYRPFVTLFVSLIFTLILSFTDSIYILL